ncbi:hypothetical protein CJU89_5875 [Yarrowia sp. B02]|nr:hypothetical protein CJU89_5875 [Yarrowia sp. B02]
MSIENVTETSHTLNFTSKHSEDCICYEWFISPELWDSFTPPEWIDEFPDFKSFTEGVDLMLRNYGQYQAKFQARVKAGRPQLFLSTVEMCLEKVDVLKAHLWEVRKVFQLMQTYVQNAMKPLLEQFDIISVKYKHPDKEHYLKLGERETCWLLWTSKIDFLEHNIFASPAVRDVMLLHQEMHEMLMNHKTLLPSVQKELNTVQGFEYHQSPSTPAGYLDLCRKRIESPEWKKIHSELELSENGPTLAIFVVPEDLKFREKLPEGFVSLESDELLIKQTSVSKVMLNLETFKTSALMEEVSEVKVLQRVNGTTVISFQGTEIIVAGDDEACKFSVVPFTSFIAVTVNEAQTHIFPIDKTFHYRNATSYLNVKVHLFGQDAAISNLELTEWSIYDRDKHVFRPVFEGGRPVKPVGLYAGVIWWHGCDITHEFLVPTFLDGEIVAVFYNSAQIIRFGIRDTTNEFFQCSNEQNASQFAMRRLENGVQLLDMSKGKMINLIAPHKLEKEDFITAEELGRGKIVVGLVDKKVHARYLSGKTLRRYEKVSKKHKKRDGCTKGCMVMAVTAGSSGYCCWKYGVVAK